MRKPFELVKLEEINTIMDDYGESGSDQIVELVNSYIAQDKAEFERRDKITDNALFIMEKEMLKSREECKELIECLKFFSDSYTWARVMADAAHVFHDRNNPILDNLYGSKAREVLKKYEKE